jgi:ClpP class serine protease
LADGRIFTGAQAKELGLVDELGGIWAAIDRAAKLGGIEGEPRVVWPMRRRNILEGLLNRLAPGFIDRSLSPSPVRAMYLLSPG